MSDYADTSFFLRLFLPGGRMEVIDRAEAAIKARTGGFLPITAYGRLELIGAIRLETWRNKHNRNDGIPAAIAGPVLAQITASFSQDVREISVAAWEAVFAEAEALTRDVVENGWRVPDLIHVASASRLGARFFYTLDGRQGDAARSLDMETPLRELEIKTPSRAPRARSADSGR